MTMLCPVYCEIKSSTFRTYVKKHNSQKCMIQMKNNWNLNKIYSSKVRESFALLCVSLICKTVKKKENVHNRKVMYGKNYKWKQRIFLCNVDWKL